MYEAVRVVHGEINHLSNRAAMGLPESYTSPNCEQASWALQTDTGRSARDLVAVIENPARPLEERLVCAALVTLQGDPRIDVFDPPMVSVPGGSAALGLDEQRVDALFRKYEKYGVHRNWIEKECPRFTAEIASFRLGKYPVTNLEYRAFLKDAPQEAGIPTSWPDGRMPLFRDNYPVYTVTPEDADAYCAWLARKTGRRFRLPSEYEWEYAAAGPEGQDYPWGNTFESDACNTLENGLLTTSPIGLFAMGASWVGAHDMAGNVEEYVSGRYHPYPGGSIVEDDLYQLLGFYRIARGGAYNRFQDLARCQRRHGPYPKSIYAMGFRLAEEIE